MKHKSVFILVTIMLVACLSCAKQVPTRYGMYYWRTQLEWSQEESAWADSQGVETLYLRLFDVISDPAEPQFGLRPEATLRMNDPRMADGLRGRMKSIVPVVFLAPGTVNERVGNKLPLLAHMLLNRIDQVTEKNGLGKCQEIQIDYDWTQRNMQTYYNLLQLMADTLHRQGRTLSTTIRLHQLAMQSPPVDRGVLMCYNTGRLTDPDEHNSILTIESVTPYLRHLPHYSLPLSLALPQYGWNLVFHDRKFCFIAPGLELNDTARFNRIDATHYRALTYHAVTGTASAATNNMQRIYPGDIVRREDSSDSLNNVVMEMMRRVRPEITEEVVYYHN